jgi:hypothetical protein
MALSASPGNSGSTLKPGWRGGKGRKAILTGTIHQRATLAGVELMPMLKKGQIVVEVGEEGFTPAAQFNSLVA